MANMFGCCWGGLLALPELLYMQRKIERYSSFTFYIHGILRQDSQPGIAESSGKIKHRWWKQKQVVILDLYNAMVSTIDKFRQDACISVHVFLTTQCFLYASQFSS